VSLPAPEPGLVIRYFYLWLREHREGHEEGTKDRPCALVLAVRDSDNDTHVLVVPGVFAAPNSCKSEATCALDICIRKAELIQ
jgi:hypothetical protein